MNENTAPIGNIPKPSDLFLKSKNRSYSYRDLYHFSHVFTELLKEKKVDISTPVGLYAQASDTLTFIIAACWLKEIPFVSFNPESNKQLQRIKTSAVITDSRETLAHSTIISLNVLNLPKIVDNKHTEPPEIIPPNLCQNTEKIFGYFFTSGTSGTPKIVQLKRRQMISAAQSSAENLRPHPNDCWLLCLPLHHIGGISVIFRSLLYGSAIYQMHPFDSQEVYQLLSNEKTIVAASLVPTMLQQILSNHDMKVHSKFKSVLLGGGPIYPSLLKQCTKRTIPVITSYGMTETCAQIAANPIAQQTDNLESVGSIFEPNTMEIRDDMNRPLTHGTSGSIWLKGPQVFDGYTQDKQSCFDEDGWFNTGDFGRMDEKRNLTIEARRTDLIITGGENVSPFEVEAILSKIKGVQEAAVIGVPDEKWGQKLVAAIIYEGDKKDLTQFIKKELTDRLEGYKIPKNVILVEALPRTETGKIKRSELQSFFNSYQ